MKRSSRIFLGYVWAVAWIFCLFPLFLYWLSFRLDRWLDWTPFLPQHLNIILSIPFFLMGTGWMIWSFVYLVKVGKGHPLSEPGMEIQPKTTILITSGPYRYTRNPMILGYWFMLLGLSLALNSKGFLILLTPVLILLSGLYIIAVEEPWTEKRFGAAYEDYKRSTPRFIPGWRLGRKKEKE